MALGTVYAERRPFGHRGRHHGAGQSSPYIPLAAGCRPLYRSVRFYDRIGCFYHYGVLRIARFSLPGPILMN